LMMDLLKAEEQCVYNVRQSEREVLDILDDRLHQELTTELSVSIYDTQRNDKAKRHREMLVGSSACRSRFIQTYNSLTFISSFEIYLLQRSIRKQLKVN